MPLRSEQKQDRVGGPGASHENAKHPEKTQMRGQAPEAKKPTHHSGVSGGGGEPDSHHTHDPYKKGSD